MNPTSKLKPYKKSADRSYALGVFPTLELLAHQPHTVLKVLVSSQGSSNKGVLKIKRLCEKLNIRTEVADRFIARLAGKDNCYAVGVFRKYESKVLFGKNHVVLVGIKDMGNLGTICRTMLGFNIDNLVIIKPAADIFDPKAVRASMGAIFQVNFQYFASFSDYHKIYTYNNYPFMTAGKTALSTTVFKAPFALIFGSEADGLDDSYANIGTSVVIPQSTKIDSLNLSVAVGIALYKILGD